MGGSRSGSNNSSRMVIVEVIMMVAMGIMMIHIC